MKLYYYLLVLFIFSFNLSFSDSNGIWTYPKDIRAGIFGSDEALNPIDNYTFNNHLEFNENVFLNDILYTSSNIGIGISNPSQRLEINGSINASSFYSLNNSFYFLNPSGVSFLNLIRSEAYFSYDSLDYYIAPKDYSILNFLNTNILNSSIVDSNLIKLDNIDINVVFVNENQINSITGDMIVDSSITSDDLGEDSVGASELVLEYESGSAFDSRFVNENQLNSITSDMIVDNNITTFDVLDNTITSIDIRDATINLNDLSPSLQDLLSDVISFYQTCALCDFTIGNCAEFDTPDRIKVYSNHKIGVVCDADFGVALSGGIHNQFECELVGSLIDIGGGEYICKIPGSSCPIGWSQYQQYSTTTANTCYGTGCGAGSCVTGSHSLFSNLVETCTYERGGWMGGGWRPRCKGLPSPGTCSATLVEIGCN